MSNPLFHLSYPLSPIPYHHAPKHFNLEYSNVTTTVLNILLVEDNPGDIRLLQEILLEVTSVKCQITPAMTLAAALQQLSSAKVRFDVILLDLSLPDSRGLASFLNLHRQAMSIPIVVLTGSDDENLALTAMQQGAQDYLIKGQVDSHLLLRSIRYAIERERTEAALRQTKIELERRVVERTRDLQQTNQQLQLELLERQRAEASLQQTEDDLRDALHRLNFHFENSPLAVVEWDREFRVSRWSATAEKVFGWTAPEVLGKHPHDWKFVTDEDVERMDGVMERLMSGKESCYVTTSRCFRRDGKTIECEWYNSALLDDRGQMESVLSLALDVTDRHQIERMKDEFVAIVSHELRTPLTSIYGSLSMLASGLLDLHSPKGKRLLDIAVDSTDRLMRLVNDILDIERIESGTVTTIKAVCTVMELMNKAVDIIQPLADNAGIILHVDCSGGQVWVDGDRLIQTFTNLLSNAIKFSPNGSTVWFSSHKQGGQILFEVRDFGRGIPPDKLGLIFERFQQVDVSDARNGEGTGLGLSICKSIVQQHGGQIWVESTVGQGSTFSFMLPRSPSASDSKPPQNS
jgi:PAS domain S-box-containing protein